MPSSYFLTTTFFVFIKGNNFLESKQHKDCVTERDLQFVHCTGQVGNVICFLHKYLIALKIGNKKRFILGANYILARVSAGW